MHILIILAHGSRRQAANVEIKALATKVSRLDDARYDKVTYAYLEVVAPDLPAAINKSVKQGASQITVMPYFLNTGNHLSRDIPQMLEQAIADHPACKFNLSAHIGGVDDMPALVLAQSKRKPAT